MTRPSIRIRSDRPRFLITRLSHIGDCVLTLPIICALKRRFPDCFIAWAVESPSHILLEDHPELDEVVRVPKGWLKSPGAILQLRKKLRSLKINYSIDPQSLTKSSALARLSGADHRIGFGGYYGREASRWLNNHRMIPTQSHLVDRSMQLLSKFGMLNQHVTFHLPIRPEALRYADAAIEQAGLQNDRFALINPGGSWASKRWEVERYAIVARHLQQQGNSSMVVWAGDEEKRMAEKIVELSAGAASLAPATSLPELVALSARAKCFIGSDSGPMHIAAAVGTRCVALFGPTRPQLSGPYGTGHISLQAYYQAGSSKERRRADNVAMRAITSEQVCEACDVIFGAKITGSRRTAA